METLELPVATPAQRAVWALRDVGLAALSLACIVGASVFGTGAWLNATAQPPRLVRVVLDLGGCVLLFIGHISLSNRKTMGLRKPPQIVKISDLQIAVGIALALAVFGALVVGVVMQFLGLR